MNIPWEDLEVLLAVFEEKSFSGAARRLSITQPTVSRRVSALEARLAAPLFIRDVEGAKLTETGARLLPAALQMARFSEEANRLAAGEAAHEGKLVIGTSSSEADEVLLWFVPRLSQQLPDLTLETRSASFDQLRRAEVDLLLGGSGEDSRELQALGKITIQMGAYASPGFIEEWKKTCGKRATRPERWLTPRKGTSSHLSTEDHHMRVRAATLGLGVVALPRVSHPGLEELVELRGELAPRELYFWAHPAVCSLARTRALYSLLVRDLAQEDGFLFTPKKGSPLSAMDDSGLAPGLDD